MNTCEIKLWYVRETEQARLYATCEPEHAESDDMVWVPKSIIEHTSKRGNEHVVKLPDWFVDKEEL
jgi:hypothetical protein